LICCVLAVEITEHDVKPVFEQIRMTQELRQRLYDATRDRTSQDLVSIEREAGALLCFVADAEACFTTALALRQASLAQDGQGALPLRIGINLGLVEVLEAGLGEAYLSGEGRLDAERLMRQGAPCQVSVSRSFFELLCRTAPELAVCLQYQGLLSDTVAPALGWYRVDPMFELGEKKPVDPSPTAGASSTVMASSHRRPSDTPVDVQSRAAPSYLNRAAWTRWAVLALLAVGVAFALSGGFQRDPPVPQVASVAQDYARKATAEASVQPEPVAATRDPAAFTVARKPTTSALVPDAETNALAASPAGRKDATTGVRFAARAQTKRTRPVEKPQPAALASSLPGTGSGTIHLMVRPWGDVYVDGRQVGVTPPLKVLRVPSGRRLITIRNNAAPIYRRELSVTPDAKMTVRHDFTCTPTREKPCRPVPGQ
jgi:hypothetical protein